VVRHRPAPLSGLRLAAPPAPAPRGSQAPAAPSASAAASSVAAQRALLDQYCVTCHNARLKTANLLLDQLDLSRLPEHVDVAETVVRKVRAGLMPPTSARKPDPAALRSLVSWMEGELDRAATTHLPAPGLHRLNRTEYTNAIATCCRSRWTPARSCPRRLDPRPTTLPAR
jgi:mono/diheme cytochrome c family protein